MEVREANFTLEQHYILLRMSNVADVEFSRDIVR